MPPTGLEIGHCNHFYNNATLTGLEIGRCKYFNNNVTHFRFWIAIHLI